MEVRMAIVSEVKSVAEAVKQQFDSGSRAAIRARRAVRDGVDTATFEVKRRPWVAVGAAAVAGGVVGCIIGFASGRCRRA
jgi:ElaB/YqjD/DUF883 family membrane-anchored ribosome-binding protein